MWGWIYNADYGSLNALLNQLGIIPHYIPWLINPMRAMNLVIVADIWHSVPFIALILQAAMASISPELEEAAAVDGANAWQRFSQIRLPLLRSAILVALVIRTVEAFRVFDIIYVITNGGPAFGTVTISFLTYLETFSYGHLGRGASLSFLISLFTLVLALIYIRWLYRPEVKQ
jgi:ABC-type sugar transport system permease subunit